MSSNRIQLKLYLLKDTAKGEVWADTWYEVNVTAEKVDVQEGFTANKQTTYVLYLGGMEFNFLSQEIAYEKYEEVTKVQSILFYGRISLYLEKDNIMKNVI